MASIPRTSDVFLNGHSQELKKRSETAKLQAQVERLMEENRELRDKLGKAYVRADKPSPEPVWNYEEPY